MPYKFNPFTGKLDLTSNGGTTLPAAEDGESLIYENGQWVAGPVIGGVNYTTTGDADYASVELLLHGNGTDGSTTFTDNSPDARTPLAANGGIAISTDQSKFGGSSIEFDGTDDYLTYTSDTTFDWYNAGAFTVEAWVYASSFAGWDNALRLLMVGKMSPTASFNDWSFGPTGSGTLRFYYYTGSHQSVTTTTTMATGQWHHVAMTYDGTNIRLFINGTLETNASVSGTPRANSGVNYPISIGSWSGNRITGYIDDLRITSGVARYTTSFTAPTAQFADNGGTVSIPAADSIRTILGIDEYADDTAAGTGGLSSGELYYNTTSSSYVLKT